MTPTILMTLSKRWCCKVIILNLLIDCISLSTIQYPLCGSTDSQSTENDQIIFKEDLGLRSVVINGTRILCIPTAGTTGPRRNDNNVPPRFGPNSMQQTQPIGRPIRNSLFFTNTINCNNRIGSFGSDVIDGNIVKRNNADYDENLCESFEEIIYPTSGERQDDTNCLIVNTKKYRQGVRISRCLNVEEPCRMVNPLSNLHQAICKQQYFYRELLAVTPDGNVTKEKFKFPSNCACVLRRM